MVHISCVDFSFHSLLDEVFHLLTKLDLGIDRVCRQRVVRPNSCPHLLNADGLLGEGLCSNLTTL